MCDITYNFTFKVHFRCILCLFVRTRNAEGRDETEFRIFAGSSGGILSVKRLFECSADSVGRKTIDQDLSNGRHLVRSHFKNTEYSTDEKRCGKILLSAANCDRSILSSNRAFILLTGGPLHKLGI